MRNGLKFRSIDSDTVEFYKTCTVTGKEYSVRVEEESFFRWIKEEPAQWAFRDLGLSQREFIISGTTPDEWYVFFGEPE